MFVGTQPVDRPNAYKDCGETYFYNAIRETLMATDAATDSWYEGRLNWDFKNGAPFTTSSANNQKKAASFATMIWKGTNIPKGGNKVGFGINTKCGYVLAWYCPNRPKDADIKAKLQNVCNINGVCTNSDYMCTKDGYDSCYNTMAAKAHNVKRTLHCAKPMTVDIPMAKALQKMLANK